MRILEECSCFYGLNMSGFKNGSDPRAPRQFETLSATKPCWRWLYNEITLPDMYRWTHDGEIHPRQRVGTAQQPRLARCFVLLLLGMCALSELEEIHSTVRRPVDSVREGLKGG